VIIARQSESTSRRALNSLAAAGDVQWHAVDVVDGKSVTRLIETIMGKYDRLDYAFNNGASGGHLVPVANMSEDAWRKTIDGYLTSVFLCMNAELRVMKESGSGVIVNNASVDGLCGYPFKGGAACSAACRPI
jgi:NAD(P)-dependent dehydrogenase (short-subunit alcohol dehydrogenase family)